MMQLQMKVDLLNIMEAQKQPIAYPTMTPENVWDWMGDCGIFFGSERKDLNTGPNGCFGNNRFLAFQECFDVVYTTEGLLFLLLKPEEKRKDIQIVDNYECIPNPEMGLSDEEKEKLPRQIHVINTHYIDDNDIVELSDVVEWDSSISVKEFMEHVYGKTSGVQAWMENRRYPKIEEIEDSIE